jgi:hypothetical protein
MSGREKDERMKKLKKRGRLRSARNFVFECAHERALDPPEYALAQGLMRRHVFNLN